MIELTYEMIELIEKLTDYEKELLSEFQKRSYEAGKKEGINQIKNKQ